MGSIKTVVVRSLPCLLNQMIH